MEVNTGYLHLAVNSQNSLPVEALNLIDLTLFHGDHFVFSVHSAAIYFFLGKNASIRSKLPTAVCWCQEKGDEGVKSNCFLSKATSVPQVNHSQYSSPVEALNLIVESKSLSAEVNDLNIELHLPIEVKEKLEIILLYIIILTMMRFDMTFDDASRCVTAPVSVNSQIHCIKFSLLLVLFKLKG